MAFASINRDTNRFIEELRSNPEVLGDYYWFSLLDENTQNNLIQCLSLEIPHASRAYANLTSSLSQTHPHLAKSLAVARPVLPLDTKFALSEALKHYRLAIRLSLQAGEKRLNTYHLEELADLAPEASSLVTSLFYRCYFPENDLPLPDDLGDSTESLAASLLAAHSEKNQARARSLFAKLIQANPNFTRSDELRSWALTDREEEVLLYYLGEHLTDSNPAGSLENLQGLLLAKKDTEAISLAEKHFAGKVLPKDLHLALLIAITKRDQKTITPSTLFTDALASHPHDPVISILTAAHMITSDNFQPARQLWEKIVSSDQTIASYDFISQFISDHGLRHRTKDDSDLHPFLIATSVLRALTPPDVLTDPELLRELAKEARSFEDTEFFGKNATALLQRAYTIWPEDPDTLQLLAVNSLEKEDPQAAICYYRKALHSPYLNTNVRRDLAKLLIEENQYAEALTVLNRNNPEYDPSDLDLSLFCLEKLGEKEKAKELVLTHLSADQPPSAVQIVQDILSKGNSTDLTDLASSMLAHDLSSLPVENSNLEKNAPAWHQPDLSVNTAIRLHQLGHSKLARQLLLQHVLNTHEPSSQHLLALIGICWEGRYKQYAMKLMMESQAADLFSDGVPPLPTSLTPLRNSLNKAYEAFESYDNDF